MGIFRRSGMLARKRTLLGAIHIDGERAQIAVCAGPRESDAGLLLAARDAMASDVPELLYRINESAQQEWGAESIRWAASLPGAEVLHDVVEVPTRVRQFEDQRLEACLAATHWRDRSVVETSGYRLAVSFEDTSCAMAFAPVSTLREIAEIAEPERLTVTTQAESLRHLVATTNPELCEPGAPATMAMLCDATTFACAMFEGGELRLLFQTGLAPLLEEFVAKEAAARARTSSADAPVEFETSSAHTPAAPAASAAKRAVDVDPTNVEPGVYQAILMRVFQDALTLYREQYRDALPYPERLLLTGDAVTRHSLIAFFNRHLGAQFAVEEIDAARVVRIVSTGTGDEATRARDVAARQHTLAGALALLAFGAREGALRFDLSSLDAEPPEASPRRAARDRSGAKASAVIPRGAVAAVAIGALLAGAGVATRIAWIDYTRADLAERIEAERKRAENLKAIYAERIALEAQAEHTRQLLAAIRGMKSRQVLPPQLLATIESSLPKGTQLDEIQLSAGNVVVSGYADDREIPTQFALALERMKDTFASVTPQTDQTVVKVFDPSSEQEVDRQVFSFRITARYIKNVASEDEQRVVGPQRAPSLAEPGRTSSAPSPPAR